MRPSRQLYLASEQLRISRTFSDSAVETMETTGEEALLAEALTTHGLVLCKLGRRHEAKPILHRARRVAERCGDYEGAGRALLILIEEMCDQLGEDERQEIGAQASQLLANSQHASTCERLEELSGRELPPPMPSMKNYANRRLMPRRWPRSANSPLAWPTTLTTR